VLVTTLAAALAVTGIAVAATRGHAPTHIRVAAPPSSTTTTTIPSSFKPLTTGVEDWTWVSDDHGWALVRKPCGATVCVGLRETIDGGRTWKSLPAPEALDWSAQFDKPGSCAARPCLWSVRFATSKIGWLFGPALFQTGDGGHTWTRVRSAAVKGLEAANGFAMRVTTPDPDCGGGCGEHIDRMRLGSSSWERVPISTAYFPSLLLQGRDFYDVETPNWAGAGQTHLRHSSDNGATWTEVEDPCQAPSDFYRTASASAAPRGVLVVLCMPATADSGAVQVSTDRGKTFGPRRAVPNVTPDRLGPIAAASADTIAIAYTNRQKYGVLVTHDGGLTWQATLVPSAAPTRATTFIPSLGWEDAHTARASFNTSVIWTTRDGGRSWTENRVAP
jgi:photosystem II stability/assembly factor-like uncharacterized protein